MRPRALAAALAAGLLPCLVCNRGHADTPPDPAPDPVIVTATRLPLRAVDVAAGVDIIDQATIQARGYTTLADALGQVAGLHLVQSGGPGANASLFVRGANSNQVQVLIDGVPVNDPDGPGGAFNFGVDSLAGIARIEIVRGPMSAVYGSGAIGGVVNLVTNAGDQNTPAIRTHALIAAGLPAALLAQAGLSGHDGAWDYALDAQSRSDRGFDATPQRQSVRSGERDGSRENSGGASLGYTPLAGTRLFAQFQGRTTVLGYDDVGYPAFDDPDETGRDNAAFARAGITSALFGGVWTTTLAGSFQQEYRRYVNLLDTDDPNQAAEDSRYLGRRFDVQWLNSVRLPDAGPLTANALTFSLQRDADTARQRLDSSYFGAPYIATVSASDHRQSANLGLLTTLAQQLVLTGNVREEGVSGLGDAATWRLGASWHVLPAVHLKASLGTAFLAPSLFDRYGLDDAGYVGNPSLRPERSHGWEAGAVVDLHRATSLALTWFHSDVRDLIQTVFSPAYTSVNVAGARLQGLELTLHSAPAPWISADATYTYTDARDSVTGQRLLRRPADTGSLALTLRPIERLSLVPQLVVTGADTDALVDDAGYPAGTGRNPGGLRLDLSATLAVTPRIDAFAWARNLTGSRAEAASGYAPPGRSFLAGLRWAG